MTHAELVQLMRTAIAARLKCDPAALDPDQEFADMGMKSLDAVVVSGVLEDELGRDVDPSVLFENRTMNAVAEMLAPAK